MTRHPPPAFDDLDIEGFRARILDWYATFRRELPWRGEPNPYRVLVSEVMLQQTGVGRVIPAYAAFLERFPTLDALAAASVADVLRAWRGLGYNRRALNLKRAAELVVREHGGRMPSSVEELEALPGIGRYTARAVACFGFGVQVAVVDTNVRRVLARLAGRELTARETEALAALVLPPGRAVDWNQALMDYGALVVRARPRRRGATTPFRETDRFWRGRIMDALRARDALPVPALLEALPEEGRDEARVRRLVRTLREEGLVAYDPEGDRAGLPE